jgi:hypothetical protein
MKTILINIILITITFFYISCEPQRFCTEPKCSYSDVNTDITATLSGNLDSIINIGDTIWLQVKIPDTMQTNYGEIVFSYLWQNSFFGLTSSGGDTVIGESTGAFLNSKELRPISFLPYNDKYGARKWDYPTRNFICYFIPTEKGKYAIQLTSGRIEMTDNKGKDWLINPNIILNTTLRVEQNLSWMDVSMRAEAELKLREMKNRYVFEAR